MPNRVKIVSKSFKFASNRVVFEARCVRWLPHRLTSHTVSCHITSGLTTTLCRRCRRVQSWKIGKLKAKVTAERAKLEKAVTDEAAGGGGGGAGEASRTVRRKLLDEAADRKCWYIAVIYSRWQLIHSGWQSGVDVWANVMLVCSR